MNLLQETTDMMSFLVTQHYFIFIEIKTSACGVDGRYLGRWVRHVRVSGEVGVLAIACVSWFNENNEITGELTYP